MYDLHEGYSVTDEGRVTFYIFSVVWDPCIVFNDIKSLLFINYVYLQKRNKYLLNTNVWRVLAEGSLIVIKAYYFVHG